MALAVCAATIPIAQAANLIAHWGFDEVQGSAAFDSLGGYDGILYGAQWTSGVVGGAIDLDGVDDCVILPDNEPVWLPRHGFCIVFWIKPRRPVWAAAANDEWVVDLNHANSSMTSRELGVGVARVLYENAQRGRGLGLGDYRRTFAPLRTAKLRCDHRSV